MSAKIHRLDDAREPETYPVVAGLPIPPKQKGQPPTKLTKTLRTLKVGDSFMMKYTAKGMAGPHRAADRVGIRITCRRSGDGYIRIWRIA